MKVVSLSAIRTGHLYPKKYSWYSFLLEVDLTPGSYCDRRIMSVKKSNDTIGNRTRDLPACSAVPQPTAPPRCSLRLLNISEFIDFILGNFFFFLECQCPPSDKHSLQYYNLFLESG
jgi:hypothetical protein